MTTVEHGTPYDRLCAVIKQLQLQHSGLTYCHSDRRQFPVRGRRSLPLRTSRLTLFIGKVGRVFQRHDATKAGVPSKKSRHPIAVAGID